MEQFPTQRQEYATPDQSELAGYVNGIFHEHSDTVGIWIPDRPEVPIHTMLVGRLQGDQIPVVYQDAWIAIGQLHLPTGTEVTTVAIKSVNQEDGNVMIRIIDGVPQYINKRPVNEDEARSLRTYLGLAVWDGDLSRRWASPLTYHASAEQ